MTNLKKFSVNLGDPLYCVDFETEVEEEIYILEVREGALWIFLHIPFEDRAPRLQRIFAVGTWEQVIVEDYS